MGGGPLGRCLVAAFLASVEALSLRVCVVPEGGASSPNDPHRTPADITNDAELHGYDVELRQKILTQHMALPYSVTVYPTYGALNVACRLGLCDVCWATFFQVGTRDRCLPDENLCRDINLTHFDEVVATNWREPFFDWTPYRCCVDYSPGHMTGMFNQIGVLEHRVSKPNFVAAFFEVSWPALQPSQPWFFAACSALCAALCSAPLSPERPAFEPLYKDRLYLTPSLPTSFAFSSCG